MMRMCMRDNRCVIIGTANREGPRVRRRWRGSAALGSTRLQRPVAGCGAAEREPDSVAGDDADDAVSDGVCRLGSGETTYDGERGSSNRGHMRPGEFQVG